MCRLSHETDEASVHEIFVVYLGVSVNIAFL